MIVTMHARQRYIERIDPTATLEQAAAVIHASERAVRTAHAFRCKLVKMGNGARLVLDGTRVVTVLARGQMLSDHLAAVYPRPAQGEL